MYGWKDESYDLSVQLGDLIKMARLPGKKDEYFINEVTVTSSDKLDMEEPDQRVLKITFRRTVSHKLKGDN